MTSIASIWIFSNFLAFGSDLSSGQWAVRKWSYIAPFEGPGHISDLNSNFKWSGIWWPYPKIFFTLCKWHCFGHVVYSIICHSTAIFMLHFFVCFVQASRSLFSFGAINENSFLFEGFTLSSVSTNFLPFVLLLQISCCSSSIHNDAFLQLSIPILYWCVSCFLN